MARQEAAGKDGVTEDFVSNETGDTHHGCPAVVEFDGSLPKLGVGVKLVPAKVERAISEITNELGLTKGVPVHHLGNGKEGGHLQEDRVAVLGLVQGWESLEAIGDTLKTGDTNASGSGEVTDHGQHGNTAMLEFNRSETVEALLAAICTTQIQRIKEAQLYSDERPEGIKTSW